jgi:hypothetical protein
MKPIMTRGDQTLYDLGHGRGAIMDADTDLLGPPTSIASLIRLGYWKHIADATTKRSRTVIISSGGKRRDDSLNPIVARVRRQLIELVSEHSNRPVVKYSDDQARDEAGRWTSGGGADARMFTAMNTGDISSTESNLGGGICTSYIGLVGGVKCLIKPQSGLVPIRSDIPSKSDNQREMAARVVNARMGGLVDMPTAVVRNIPGLGSSFVQEWRDGQTLNSYHDLTDAELHKTAMFDYLIGNTDRHPGNGLIDGSHFISIDHGLSFPQDRMGHFNSGSSLYSEANQAAAAKDLLNLSRTDVSAIEHLRGDKTGVTEELKQAGLEQLGIDPFWNRVDTLLGLAEIPQD